MERNIHKGHCLVCGSVVYKGQGYRREVRGRGYRIFCSRHALSLEDYHDSDAYRAEYIGTQKKMPLTNQLIGVEIEIDADMNDAIYQRFRGTLERVGYCLESDCTVAGGEAPSPKMRGLAHISKVLQNNEDAFVYFTSNTGAHIHTSTSKIDYIRRYYHSIWMPLYEYLDSHDAEWRKTKFGSDFRHYACRISEDTYPESHANFVNVQHDNTIEFRLPRIRERHQFMNVLKFWREVGFFLECYDFQEDSISSINRKEIAHKAGTGIVKIANKYFGA